MKAIKFNHLAILKIHLWWWPNLGFDPFGPFWSEKWSKVQLSGIKLWPIIAQMCTTSYLLYHNWLNILCRKLCLAAESATAGNDIIKSENTRVFNKWRLCAIIIINSDHDDCNDKHSLTWLLFITALMTCNWLAAHFITLTRLFALIISG